jgi:uncharacterized protein DUF2442
MLRDIIEAKVVGDHRLALTFDDGVRGEVDVAEMVPFEGVFAALRSQEEFARVFVNRELGSISWPCGADLDTQVLYARVQGQQSDRQAPAAS